MTEPKTAPAGLLPANDVDIREIEQFLYREARAADESSFDDWEALWTDDALYWVPAGGDDPDPVTQVSIIYDNRSRIATRLNQLRTGKRYAQQPVSSLRRMISNIEVLGIRETDKGEHDLEVGANFLCIESRIRGTELWGGRTTYRLRPGEGGYRMSYKKVVLVNNDMPLPTLGFLI